MSALSSLALPSFGVGTPTSSKSGSSPQPTPAKPAKPAPAARPANKNSRRRTEPIGAKATSVRPTSVTATPVAATPAATTPAPATPVTPAAAAATPAATPAGPAPPELMQASAESIVDNPSLANDYYVPWNAKVNYGSDGVCTSCVQHNGAPNVGSYWLLKNRGELPKAAGALIGPTGVPMASKGDVETARIAASGGAVESVRPRKHNVAPRAPLPEEWAARLFADPRAAAAAAADVKIRWRPQITTVRAPGQAPAATVDAAVYSKAVVVAEAEAKAATQQQAKKSEQPASE